MNGDASRPGGSIWLWLTYLALVALGIPWYWRLLPLDPYAIWLGVPAWTLVALVASLAVSLLTAWQLRTPWPAERDARDVERGS